MTSVSESQQGTFIMSLSASIAPHLPFLRRFSRAVSGSQTSGDALVVAVLEAIIVDPGILPRDKSPRLALYKAFSRLFSSIAIRIPAGGPETSMEARVAAHLGALAPLTRQAFLLVAIEDFTEEEAAEILDVPEEELASLLRQASEEISRQVATDVLIIEDEPLVAADIEDIMIGLGHNVVGIARTKSEATELFRRTSPGIVLADIQLANGSNGIDAVNAIVTTDPVPVVFITAFPERLLTGERPEPTFLITKPFDPNVLRGIVSQALFFGLQAKAAA
jgi:DNA-directed RNA polymerase specialized sigma24 family protein